MKRIFIPLGLLLVIIAGLFIASFLVSWETYKKDIVESIQSATGREVVIHGGITGAFLPLPHITVSDVDVANISGGTADYLLKANSLEARISLISLLQGKVKISKVTLNKAVVELEVLENGKRNWLSSDTLPSTTKSDTIISAIEITNSEVVLRKKSIQLLKKLDDFNGYLSIDSLTGPFEIEGYFIEKKAKVAFDIRAEKIIPDKETVFTWQIDMPHMKLFFDGKMIKQMDKRIISGKLNANLPDIQQNLNVFTKNTRPVKNSKPQPLSLTADAVLSEKEISLQNLSIDSSHIKGTGRIKAFFDTTPIVDIILDFDDVNIDSLRDAIAGNQKQKSEKPTYSQGRIKYTGGDFPKNINALLYLTAKKITYNNKVIQDFTLNTDLFNGNIEIYPSTAALEDNTKLEVSGNIASNGVRPVFEGSIVASGDKLSRITDFFSADFSELPLVKVNNFNITTQLRVTPKEVRFSNIDYRTDTLNIAGLFNIRHGSGIPEINTNLTLSTLNLDNPIITDKARVLLQPFSAKNISNLGTDFQWLRTFPIRFDAEIMVQELQYNQRSFKNPLVIFHIVPGFLECDKLMVDSDIASFDAKGSLDIQALRPKISLSIKGKNLDMAMFSLPEKKKVLIADTENSGALSIEEPITLKPKWSSEEFDFIAFDKFNGSVHASLDNFTYHKISAENLLAKLRLSDGLLIIDDLRGELFDGKFLAKGGIGITPPSLSVSFSLSNGILEKFFPAFTSIDTIDGYFSMSGSFTTQGATPEVWASAVEANISLAVRDMIIKNFDLHKIIETTYQKNIPNNKNFAQVIEEASNNGTTLFNNVDGALSASNGLLQVSDMKFNTLRTSGAMSGSLDIKNWVMRVLSQIAFIPQGSTLALPINISLAGAVENPERTIDTKEIWSYILNKSTPKTPEVSAPLVSPQDNNAFEWGAPAVSKDAR